MENIFVREPKTGRTAKLPLLLALHGNASSAAASLDAWQSATKAGWLVALPQSTRVDEDGEYIWNPPMRNEWPVTEIQNHYQQLLEQYPIDPEQVVLSGFSMGGGLAIWLALRGYIRARGFLVVAPYLPYEYVEAPEMTITPSNPLRGYVVVGEQDDPTFGFSEKFTTRIEQAGIPCQRVSYPGLEHDYPPDFDAVLLQGLQFIG